MQTDHTNNHIHRKEKSRESTSGSTTVSVKENDVRYWI